jgi:hypothetical protein
MLTEKKQSNGRVDAAARFHSTIAGPFMMRNTPPPLASNGLMKVGLQIQLAQMSPAG